MNVLKNYVKLAIEGLLKPDSESKVLSSTGGTYHSNSCKSQNSCMGINGCWASNCKSVITAHGIED